MTPHAVDVHWLDFYALLGVPATADEDSIRKRIGRVYTEAAANSDHRDLARRHYFQALLERVLPQCRRVLLDPEWRAKYDRQHILNANGDPQAQNYVEFIASMRGKARITGAEEAEVLPERLQEDISLAREVVECARQGAHLELLPSQAVSNREAGSQPDALTQPIIAATAPSPTPARRAGDSQAPSQFPHSKPHPALVQPALHPAPVQLEAPAVAARAVAPPVNVTAQMHPSVAVVPVAETMMASAGVATMDKPLATTATHFAAPVGAAPVGAPMSAPTPIIEEIVQSGAAAHAQVLTAEEAAVLRRERMENRGRDASVAGGLASTKPVAKAPNLRRGTATIPASRIVVGDDRVAPKRVLSSTSLNLMVAIVGVVLTITVQRFSGTPAVASAGGRTPIFIAVAPEMETAVSRAETAWEKTPEGQNYDIVVQSTASRAGLSRALGSGERLPDAWIPTDSSWIERYNRRAPSLKRGVIGGEGSLAQSPMVLMARREHAAELRRLFPNHQITSWQALRGAIARGAAGHLGLADPQKTESGALARLSMAREWGANNGQSPALAAKNPGFWRWMSGFEDNAPSASSRTADMVKDMAQGTTGRFWWVVAYESDALQWMQAGKSLEIFYLPRTTYANHPFCALERVGAGSDVAAGRAAFEKYLRSAPAQKALLGDGFRPTEINLKSKVEGNPFLSTAFRARGARLDGLPLEERTNTAALEIVAQQWGTRFG